MQQLRSLVLILCSCMLFCTHISAQDSSSVQPEHKLLTRKNIVIVGLLAQQASSFYVEYKWWWEGDYHPFVINSDGWFNNYSLGIDKVGHFYTSYMYFNILNETMKWAGFSNKTRTITSVTLPFLYALSIEIGDGFSTYNFSLPDLASNSLGICYGLLQDKVPVMRNFTVKFSYFPSQYYFDNHFRKWSLTDDYDGHIYWLTADVHNLLRGNAKKYWPAFLNLGAGYGIQHRPSGLDLQREFFLGLDYNLGAIHTKDQTVKGLLSIFDKLHYPAPGLKQLDGEKVVPKWLILN